MFPSRSRIKGFYGRFSAEHGCGFMQDWALAMAIDIPCDKEEESRPVLSREFQGTWESGDGYIWKVLRVHVLCVNRERRMGLCAPAKH
jgi:hypothetical protein